jgi:MFS-type transporter involved in bile tolerance (Atg22 family)
MSEAKLHVGHPRRSFAFLLLANFVWMIGLGLYVYFIGLYLINHLGAGPVEVGMYSAVLMLSALLFVPLGGPLTARFGEKWLLVASWASIIPAPWFTFSPRHGNGHSQAQPSKAPEWWVPVLWAATSAARPVPTGVVWATPSTVPPMLWQESLVPCWVDFWSPSTATRLHS